MATVEPRRDAVDAMWDCVVCPRLCRDVCPVAVHSFRDDLVPSEKMRAALAVFGGHAGGGAASATTTQPASASAAALGDDVHEQVRACTGCGACTSKCLLGIPVGAWLAEAQLRVAGGRESAAGEGTAAPALRASGQAAPPAPEALAAPATHALACCGRPAAIDARALSGDPAQRRALAATPQLPATAAPVVEPALGASCCGARLPADIGDPGLRSRMARAMLAALPDGARVALAERDCAAWLAAHADGRVEVGWIAAAASAAPAD